ncbi:MAG: hypothetical protein WAK91_08415 [Candidatus Acidiferrales bacterium]
MRPPIAATLVIFCFCVCVVLAQDAKKPQEPEYANAFFSLDKDGNLKPLERQAAKIETKVRAGGYGGADSKYVVPNEHSTVRFPANVGLQFVVRPEPNNVDPATIIQLYSLKVAKGQREVRVAKFRQFSGDKSTLGTAAVSFDIAKYGENSVLLKPQTTLAPGEYMWAANSTLMVPQAYCFGVDAPNP